MIKITKKDLAPIAIPHGSPVEAAAEYFRSKMEGGQAKKYPVWDVARPTPQVQMEHARRDMMEAEENLELKRIEEKQNREMMDKRWQELREKELALKQSFISFNKFIRENQEKRERADRKMKEDVETLERKKRETEEMRGRVAEMENMKKMMEKQVKDYSIYEIYLFDVMEKYPEYKQPLDILNRYEALAAAKSALAARQQRDLELLESARVEMSRLTEDKKLVILGLNNTLATLRTRYDDAHNTVLKWELALTRLKETAAQRQVELYRIKQAIWSLYLKICTHKGLEVVCKESDFESQLVVIMRALLELRRILRITTRRAAGLSNQLIKTNNP